MPDLIPFTPKQIGTETIQTVDARDIHTFLKVATRFNDWITRQIETFGFVQDVDFISYSNLSNHNPHPPIEYAVTFDMAKELSMVERTAKGKEARRYFIECEKRLLNQPVRTLRTQTPLTPAQLQLETARLALAQARTAAAQARTAAAQARTALAQARTALAQERFDRLTTVAVPPTPVQPSPPPPAPPVQYSVIQWLMLHEKRCSLAQEAAIGKACARLSRERGRPIGKAADRRWKDEQGEWKAVGAYDEDLISEVWYTLP
jgi:phage anti-repressor protein